MLPIHTPAPREQSPLLASAKKGQASWSLSALGQGSCLLASALAAACAFALCCTVLRGHARHRHVPHAPHRDGCVAAETVKGYRELDRLFAKHGSERGSRGSTPNGYHKLYGSLFWSWQRSAKLVVEVGAGRPGLLTWRDYFQNAQVVGMDIDPKTAILGEPRVVTVTGSDTTNPFNYQRADLYDVGIDARANILIDDGAHDPTLQGRTLENMYDILDDGGVYIVEDLLRKPDGGSHFCGMAFQHPFVFGAMQERGATRSDYVTRKLGHIVAGSEVFYAAMAPGRNDNNAMVLLKNWTSHRKPFAKLPHNYHVVYNALLSAVPVRGVVASASRKLLQQPTAAACGDPHGVDVIIAAAQEGITKQVLRSFHRARSGSFLFVEGISFSFCDGAPDPSTLGGEAWQSILASNPDWFYAMTDSDSVRSAKMLVLRKL